MSSVGGWPQCDAGSDPLPKTRQDSPHSPTAWAEQKVEILPSFNIGRYLLRALWEGWIWFGLSVDLDGSN